MTIDATPTQKGEREEALELARWIDIADKPMLHAEAVSERGVLLLARALLSSSKTEGEMREALTLVRMSRGWQDMAGETRAIIDAALSPKESA